MPALLAAGFALARRAALPPLRGNRYVAMQAAPDVVVFSRPGCAYCAKAKSLLKQRGVAFGVVDIAAEEERRAEAVERSKASTVPQVFVGSRCLGGFDDLRRLDEAGGLVEALKRSAEDDVYIAPTPPEKIAAAGLPEAVRSQLSERAQALSKLKYQAGSRPSLGAFLRYAVTSTPKQDQSRNVALNLAAVPGQPSPGPALQGKASELVALLRQVMLQLLEDFFDPASADVDYMAMRASPQWSLFLALAAEIGEPRLRPELESLGESDRKAFFINLYNAMTFHGVATFGRRSGWWYLYCFFITPAVSYRVAGVQMSLDDIEHGILRAKKGYFEGSGKELQRQLRMPQVDPRIHMALNCGAKGCPAVAVYTGGEELDAELDSAVAGFVAAEGNVRIKEEANGLRLDLSEIFKMYTEDFIGSKASKEPGRQLASWLLPFATPAQRPLLSKAAEGTPVHLHWIPYDWATNGTEVPLDKHIYSVTLP